jgi:hypothetical protein
MVVNYSDFVNLLNEDKSIDFMAYKIAPEIHNNWRKLGDDKGWKLEYHKDYNYLPAHLKDENIAAARRVPVILALDKLMVVHENESEGYILANYKRVIASSVKLEKFAIEEHKGWMDFKESQGWKYHKTRNDDRKLHNCLLLWEFGKPTRLPIKEQNKDKDAVLNYPVVLVEAGFLIVEKK